MRCFTVVNSQVYEGLTLFESSNQDKPRGVGLGAEIALMPRDSVFPDPEIHYHRSSDHSHSSKYFKPVGVIRRADIYLFDGKPLTTRFNAVLLKEQDFSENVLILWIVDLDSIYNFKEFSYTGERKFYVDSTTRWQGYWQGLIEMSPDCSMTIVSHRTQVTISWDGEDLKVVDTKIN